MAEYFGLVAITHRLGVSHRTLLRWYVTDAFAMYKRRRGPRSLWYTNDAMIISWQMHRAATQRQAWLRLPKGKRRGTVATQRGDVRKRQM